MKWFAGWLGRNADEISSFSALLGLVIGILGFGLTIWQLHETNIALRSTNTYAIQHDARELFDQVNAKGSIAKLINGTANAEESAKAELDAWKMFNFYLSVFRQVDAQGVGEQFGTAFSKD